MPGRPSAKPDQRVTTMKNDDPPQLAASMTKRKFFDCDRRKALPPSALTKL